MTDSEQTPTPVSELLNQPAFEAAYLELTRYAYTRTRSSTEADEVVSDTVLCWVQDVRAGKRIDNLPGYLRTVFERRLCDHLRRKYRREVEVSDDGTILNLIPDDSDPEALSRSLYEAEAVRKALGRLAAIYREVVYRHYMKGQGVEEIARALEVPVGTVKSRLSDGRGQMKETVTRHLRERDRHDSVTVAGGAMENRRNTVAVDSVPYSEVSYAPKRVTLSIWGGDSRKNEPWCYVKSLVAQNILVLAYEKPISIRELSAALGIPTPYVEHEVDILVSGEMMGRTPGGLVYTRIYLQTVEARYGDVEAQEALAARIAPRVWRMMEEGLAPLWSDETSATRTYTAKQLATFRLMLVNEMMAHVAFSPELDMRDPEIQPLPRPNEGWWLATGTVYEYGQELYAHRYSCSGPVQVNHVLPPKREGDIPVRMVMMKDYQSFFGNAHWSYGKMKHYVSPHEVARFYGSFVNRSIEVADPRIYELIPEFEALHILRRDEAGNVCLDIPAMTFDEWDEWDRALRELAPAMIAAVGAPLRELMARTVHRVPDHVDGRGAYLHEGALGCIIPATMREMAENGCIPDVVMGETPVILVVYRPEEEGV